MLHCLLIGLQEKWMNHEISNFDYLMMLNTIAGRSYHDLCQYPVMPWILSQYSQSTIDLNDPTNYRDLSKPMGAINETRLNEFLSRYESFHENIRETEIPPFMYGKLETNYSLVYYTISMVNGWDRHVCYVTLVRQIRTIFGMFITTIIP